MPIEFHRLWIFLQVVDNGGFSAAAAKLFMSQPAVSNQVRRLEAGLGATLVDRSGARVRPTAEGEVLAAYARRLFLLADEAVTAVRQVQGLAAGRLAVGGTTTVGTFLLPKLLARFHQEHTGIEIDLYVGNAEQVTQRLVTGEIGLAVLAGNPHASALCCEEILTDDLLLVAAPGHRLAGRTVPATELAGERFVVRERGSSTRELQDDALRRWDLTDVARSEVWGPETLKQSVRAGLGLTLISSHAVDHELGEDLLVAITVDPPPKPRPVVAAYRRDRLLSPAEQAFHAQLQELTAWPG